MTRHVVLFGAVAAAVLTGFACSSTSSVDANGDGQDGGSSTNTPAPDTTSNPAAEQPAGTGGNTGLPCDVEMVVENRCIACHSGDMAGVPKMLTYSDLMAKAASDPTKTIAQLSLERIKSTTNPMPPKPAEAPSADEIATWQAWADTGYAKGKACSDAPPLGDAGTTTMPDAGGTLPDGGAICTSGKFWMQGNNGSALMNPGQVCQACHQIMGGPSMSIAGTVYPTLHEPNNCDGASTNGLTVVITDAQNRVTQIPVNAAGNFYTRAKIFAPYKAKVVSGGKERAMMTAQTAGDCNRCHTQQGANGAPGRIMAP